MWWGGLRGLLSSFVFWVVVKVVLFGCSVVGVNSVDLALFIFIYWWV